MICKVGEKCNFLYPMWGHVYGTMWGHVYGKQTGG